MVVGSQSPIGPVLQQTFAFYARVKKLTQVQTLILFPTFILFYGARPLSLKIALHIYSSGECNFILRGWILHPCSIITSQSFAVSCTKHHKAVISSCAPCFVLFSDASAPLSHSLCCFALQKKSFGSLFSLFFV